MLFKNIKEVEADKDDLAAIARIESRKDDIQTYTYDEVISGKILVRVPKSLHKELKIKAQAEGVSLNQFILYKLSAG